MQAIRNISPVPVKFEDMEGQDGYYHQIEKRIAINNAISERQTMAAIIHELAHAKLHALDPEHLKEYTITPVYNFINDRLVDESAVLRSLS